MNENIKINEIVYNEDIKCEEISENINSENYDETKKKINILKNLDFKVYAY